MRIVILTDNAKSWIIPYLNDFVVKHKIIHVYSINSTGNGDILFLLGCENILTKEQLGHFKSNVVIHPSSLPKGRGWSPVAYQIIEGVNRIPVTLFEASSEVDSGDIYLLDYMELKGHELNDEIKAEQARVTLRLMEKYINNFPMDGTPQKGEPTYYKKRGQPILDVNKTIAEQFNVLRIADNDRYPATFNYLDQSYTIKIYK